MNNLQIFDYNSNQVRTLTIDNEPWFVLKDVCTLLDMSNPTMVAERLDEDERAKFNLGRQGQSWIINEPGLYNVILRSDKPEAKPFRKWVTGEVIPSIRKHGAYITKETLEQMLGSPDFAIRLLTEIKNERERSEKLAKQVEAAKPKIDFYDAVSETSGTLTIEKFAKVLYDKTGITFGRNKMFKWLRDVKMLNKNNIPYQKYMNLGWFQTHEVIRNNQPHVVTSITGKGQQELTKRLMSWHAASKM